MNATCPFCRKKVNFLAKKCPHCTAQLEGEQEWESMKKIYSIAFIVGVIIFLVLLARSLFAQQTFTAADLHHYQHRGRVVEDCQFE